VTPVVLRADARALPLPDESVHAIICDPPYGLADHRPDVIVQAITAWASGDRDRVPDGRGFMGKTWDAFVPPPAVWDEALRVLKPGGVLACFAGSRTVDLMGLSIRLAGFEIRDNLAAWLYSQSFPKSRNVSKDLDKMAGAEREVIGLKRLTGNALVPTKDKGGTYGVGVGVAPPGDVPITAPATDTAREWNGWGTALAPGHEPIILARKPLSGTVASTVLAHGTGGINIDATRVAATDAPDEAVTVPNAGSRYVGVLNGGKASEAEACTTSATSAGRWPKNVVIAHHPECVEVGTREVKTGTAGERRGFQTEYVGGDGQDKGLPHMSYSTNGRETIPAFDCHPDCQVAALDAQSGVMRARGNIAPTRSTGKAHGIFGAYGAHESPTDSGDPGGASRFFPTFRYEAKAPAWQRPHLADGSGFETVKPLDLMRWLVRLLTPPGGIVLDNFPGTGTTGQAAQLEGFRSVLVELEARHIEFIRERLAQEVVVDRRTDKAVPVTPVPADALSLFELGDVS